MHIWIDNSVVEIPSELAPDLHGHNRKRKSHLEHSVTIVQLLIWLIGVGIGIVVFAYTNFETQKGHQEDVAIRSAGRDRQFESLDKRLDRIENKIDTLLSK